jgi:hypothetical protein
VHRRRGRQPDPPGVRGAGLTASAPALIGIQARPCHAAGLFICWHPASMQAALRLKVAADRRPLACRAPFRSDATSRVHACSAGARHFIVGDATKSPPGKRFSNRRMAGQARPRDPAAAPADCLRAARDEGRRTPRAARTRAPGRRRRTARPVPRRESQPHRRSSKSAGANRSHGNLRREDRRCGRAAPPATCDAQEGAWAGTAAGRVSPWP